MSPSKSADCHHEEKPAEHFASVEANDSTARDVPSQGQVTPAERTRIGVADLACCGGKVDELRAILAEKSWFGFDLDDTLHEFRTASGKATTACLEVVMSKYSTRKDSAGGISMGSMRTAYGQILRETTAGAFSDGKASHQYRRERFSLLLERMELEHEEAFFDVLLEIYERVLTDSMQLKSGALSLLQRLKRMGKKIIVITEGPQDAQERAVEALGLRPHIDFLATTNHFKVSKVDGLFAKVLRELGISASDMAYIGDSEARDMVPAMEEGIYCIHFAERAEVALNVCPPRVTTLSELEYIVAGTVGEDIASRRGD